MIAQTLNDILVADLPTKIRINDKLYDINYDYKTVIKILTAMEDPELYYEEKIEVMLELLYKEKIPEKDLEVACEKAALFIDLGLKENKSKNTKRLYSFTKDSRYIFTGINSTHHIDLAEKPKLHWWRFMAYFMDMNTECFFSELIYYRKRLLEGKLTKEEKKKYEEIRHLVDLEDNSEEAKELSQARKKFFDELYDR